MSKEKVIAVFSVAGFVLAFVATVYANSGVNFNPGFFIPLFKNLSETIFLLSLEHLVIKLQAKRFELYFLLKLSDPKSTFRLTPGLTKLSFEQPRPGRKAKYFPIQPDLTGSISTLSCERSSFLVFLY